MKKFLKGTIFGILTSSVMILSIPSVAKNIQETINVSYKNIKIYVDSKEINTDGAEPFIYNGTTYLPIRKVGEAFGENVEWNGNTNSVYIGNIPVNEQQYAEVLDASNLAGHYTGLASELSISIYTSPSNSSEIGNADFTYYGDATIHGVITKVDANRYMLKFSEEDFDYYYLTPSIEDGVVSISIDSEYRNTDTVIMDEHYQS